MSKTPAFNFPKGKMTLAGFRRFCATLTLPNGERMRLEPFQAKMLRDYFAGVRELLIIIPKKNGKTTLLAALALYHLIVTDEADVVVVANSGLQAMKLFDEGRGFVKRSPELAARLRVLRGYKEIREKNPDDPDNPKDFLGTLKVLAADADTADGWGGTLALVDELHRAKDGELYGVLFDGLGPRSGQLVTISTAGDDEEGPLGTMRGKAMQMKGAKRVRDHSYVTNGAFSMHEWSLEKVEQIEDMRAVKRVNPASWQTITGLKARRGSPGMTVGQWARFACGIWGIDADPAFSRDRWEAVAKPGTIDAGRNVTIGFDGARRWDTTAMVACDVATGHLQLIGLWQRPPGAAADWEVPEIEVTETLNDAMKRWNVLLVYGDPPYWESTLDAWAGEFGEARVVRWWTNRYKAMAYAILAFITDMEPGRMSHADDPDLTSHILNAVRRETKMRDDQAGFLWTISKASQKSERKIDAAMAAILAWEAKRMAVKSGALHKRQHRTVALM